MFFLRFIVKYRVLFILLSLALGLGSFHFIPHMQYDNSNESFFPANDHSISELKNFRDSFGNDDFVFIMVENTGQSAGAVVREIDAMVRELEVAVPMVDRISWLGNAESVRAEGSDVTIEPVIADLSASDEELENVFRNSAADPAYRNRLISEDARTLGIMISLQNYEGDIEAARNSIAPKVYEVAARHSSLKTYVTGVPIMNYEEDHDTAQESGLWVGVSFAGMLALLLLTTRSICGIIIPMLTVLLSVCVTMALIVIFGFRVNMLLIMIPVLLLCVGIGDSMHLIAEFREMYIAGTDKKQTLIRTMQLIWKPCLMTTVTTALGFASFIFTSLIPLRELGLIAAIGTSVALLMTVIFALPAASFSMVKPGKVHPSDSSAVKAEGLTGRMLLRLAWFVDTAPGVVLSVFCVCVAVAGFGLTRLNIDTAFIQELPAGDPLRVTAEYVDSHMGGSMALEFVVKTGRADGIKDPRLVGDLVKFQNFLEQQPQILETSSFIDQLKQMNRALHGNDSTYFTVPQTEQQIAENLLMYESGGGRELDRMVSLAYDTARIQARTKSLTTSDIKNLKKNIDDYIAREMPDRTIVLTGGIALLTAVADYLAAGQLWSFIAAFITIAAVMGLFLKSVRIGLISMIPNIIPAVVAVGILGITGARINMITVTLAPIVLGVCVDDTIHFFTRYRMNFLQNGNYRSAYFSTVSGIGRVLCFTTVVTAVGFAGFMFSKWESPRNFAMVAMSAFFVALLCDLMVSPVLLRYLKPFGREKVQGR